MLPLRLLKRGSFQTSCMRWISGYFDRTQWLEEVDVKQKARDKLFSTSQEVRDSETINPLLIEVDRDLPKSFGESSKFSELDNLDTRLLQNVSRLGFVNMTPVQRYAIPAFLGGMDILACSETGSGKTHAFLVPLVHSIISEYPHEMMLHLKSVNGKYQCPLGLILTPNNALAVQIYNECEKLLCGTRARVFTTGVMDVSQTLKKLQDGCHILVGTPARIINLIVKGCLSLEFCRYLVVDEVDSFTDANGILAPYLRLLLNAPQLGLPKSENRLTVACSATVTPADEHVCNEMLSDDYMKLSPDPDFGKPVPSSIRQHFIWTGTGTDDEKMSLLIDLLNKLGVKNKILIFCKYHKCKTVESTLMKRGFVPSTIVKGLMTTRPVLGTSIKEQNIIVSSISSAFGLDFTDVRYVIIFDMPKNLSIYIHQIGRGGRMGEKADAISFFGQEDLRLADDLMILLESCGAPIPDFLSHFYAVDEV